MFGFENKCAWAVFFMIGGFCLQGCAEFDEATWTDDSSTHFQLKSSIDLPTPDNQCVNDLNVKANGPALVFNKPDALREPFKIERLLNRLIATSGKRTTPAAMLASMIDSNTKTEHRNNRARLKIPTDERPADAAINPRQALGALQPVAVFNRVDLAAPNGAHCGEQRIVYSMQTGRPFAVIFEAKIKNPRRRQGLAGCKSIAQFWVDLQSREFNTQQKADRLAELFFDGVRVNGARIAPVVHFRNYGSRRGQVRTNSFVEEKWQLREFCTGVKRGKPVFVVDTVKDTPLAELYGDQAPDGFSGNLTKLDQLKGQFRDDLINNQINRLMAPELKDVTDKKQIITGFSLNMPSKFFEFQSDAQGVGDQPSIHATSELKSRIEQTIPGDFNLNAEHILNRLNAMTCGGCHETAAGKPIAPGVKWPDSLRFLHVGRTGNLSPALKRVFLPERKKILESLLCAQ